LGLFQNKIEQILAEWVTELGVPIRYGVEVAGFAQDEDGVAVRLSDGEAIGGRLSGRLRRRAQPDPQGGRDRVPGLGRHHQRP